MAHKTEAFEKELKVLTARKQMIFQRLQTIYDSSKFKFDNSPNDNKSQEAFKVRCRTLTESKKEFEDLVERINMLNMELGQDINFSEVNSYNDIYCCVVSALDNLRGRELKSSSSNPTQTSKEVHNKPLSQFKLPKLELISFSGDERDWSVFYQSFKETIVDNNELSLSDKMRYLTASLTGRARNLISGLNPVADNFPTIWQTLVERYQDPRFLGTSYVSQFLKCRQTKETARNIEDFYHNFVVPAQAFLGLALPDPLSFLLFHLASERLSAETIRQFDLHQTALGKSNDIPSFPELATFLQGHAKSLARSVPNTSDTNRTPKPQVHFKSAHRNPSKFPPSQTFHTKRSSLRSACPVCHKDAHQVYLCEKYTRLSPAEKAATARKLNLCVNCLSWTHLSNDCKSLKRCVKCSKNHHTSLHDSFEPSHVTGPSASFQDVTTSSDGTVSNVSYKQSFHTGSSGSSSTVLLSTAIVTVFDSSNRPNLARVLLDTASQSNFITKSLCDKLGLRKSRVNSSVRGIGTSSNKLEFSTTIRFSSRFDSNCSYSAELFVLNEITDSLPLTKIPLNNLRHLQNLDLADDKFNIPGKIDLLLGASLFPLFLGSKKITGGPSSPYAIETSLGYIIMGSVPYTEPSSAHTTFCLVEETPRIDRMVEDIWALESAGVSDSPTTETDFMENEFLETTQRTSEGRYSVNLPFIKDPELLGASRETTLTKFHSLERRLRSNPTRRKAYHDFMTDYITQNHMSLLTDDDGTGCYLPHHCVENPAKTSTKLRVVWNASAKTSSGYSLNDLLGTGPKLQTDLLSVLVGFRLFRVAFVSDIRQMYRMILINPEQRQYQKIFWRFSEQEKVQVYQLNVLTFGIKPAPYLALRTVQQLSNDSRDSFPLASAITSQCSYIDDFVGSLPDETIAIQAYSELINMFSSAGFELVKWTSNSQVLMDFIPSNRKLDSEPTLNLDGDNTKVLGLKWSPARDTFYFQVNVSNAICTKRNVLSTLARIFDPLGFLAPISVLIKVLIRDFWESGLTWDEIPPQSSTLQKLWLCIIDELPRLNEIQIPRHLGISRDHPVELIGFCDASKRAFGAMVYARVRDSYGNYTVRLIAAKSKLCPQKKTFTIPRGELSSSLLLVKVIKFLLKTFDNRVTVARIITFSDSTVTLNWISAHPSRWKTFVANRVEEIQKTLPQARWNHISGSMNPADVLSRGLNPRKFIENPFWFNGPLWLQKEESEWPTARFVPQDETLEERAHTLVAHQTAENPLRFLINRVSSYNKLLRVVAYIFRWRYRDHRKFSFITSLELEKSECEILTFIQAEHFSKEISLLKANEPCSPRIRKLNPFIDNLLLVGGRLTHSDLSYYQKHPILLPKKDRVVELLIDKYHNESLHAGPNLVLSLLRQKYWILGGRDIVRQRVRMCNTCFRSRPHASSPIMGDLPKDRVTATKPFLHSGVDYAGPFHIVMSRKRGVRTQKAYLCLFVCLCTKAVHMELASDLSTPAFLNAFKRFLSRRGPVDKIYSDNATNFIGARRYLGELYSFLQSTSYQSELGSELSSHRIHWCNIPPKAPHFGGLWESNIKCAKSHFTRVIGHQILSYEEFLTVIIQVENLLNSRPLCVLSEDPNDLQALTPSHFLNQQPLGSLPAYDVTGTPINRLQRYQLLDRLVQDFWKRWRVEYLHTLQTRAKWNSPSNPIELNTVVIVKRDACPPLSWPLAVVEAVHPGPDGVTRVATIRYRGALYRRPVVKLYPLPTQ